MSCNYPKDAKGTPGVAEIILITSERLDRGHPAASKMTSDYYTMPGETSDILRCVLLGRSLPRSWERSVTTKIQ